MGASPGCGWGRGPSGRWGKQSGAQGPGRRGDTQGLGGRAALCLFTSNTGKHLCMLAQSLKEWMKSRNSEKINGHAKTSGVRMQIRLRKTQSLASWPSDCLPCPVKEKGRRRKIRIKNCQRFWKINRCCSDCPFSSTLPAALPEIGPGWGVARPIPSVYLWD